MKNRRLKVIVVSTTLLLMASVSVVVLKPQRQRIEVRVEGPRVGLLHAFEVLHDERSIAIQRDGAVPVDEDGRDERLQETGGSQ